MMAPRATYRLQFNRDFGFAEAARLAPYLAALGVSHVYASPYLKARPGSTHGYDIVAHDELNPELGSAEDFVAMNAAFAAAGLGQILDFVPNHMGVGGADNPLWLGVLEWGPSSPFSGWFDIDWEPAALYLTEKLLVPILGDQYGAVLERGELELRFDETAGEFAVWAYGTHKLPICPLHYAAILGTRHAALERLGDEFSALPEWRPQIERRAKELKRELALLAAADATATAQVAETLAVFNDSADPARRELDALIQRQYWRASHFRVAGDDINYRRFFNVNDLAGLRQELPDVFEHTHRFVLGLVREGVLDGLRIDHVDGLLDPEGYLERLRFMAIAPGGTQRPMQIFVEKILSKGERLSPLWRIDGTTGYEFANLALRVLVNGAAERPLTDAYEEFRGGPVDFPELVRQSKRLILRNEMASELNVLARDAARVARQNSRTADFTRNVLRRALRETLACFPVYRTYLNSSGELSDADRTCILTALARARRNEREIDPSVFDYLEHLLTGALAAAPRSGFSRHAAMRCAMKFQQLSGAVMAKGLEDTAFYRYSRFIALNEVGGDPESFAVSLEDFHAANIERARRWPGSMLTTATHDTKRGEDVRARLAALSEIPEDWASAVKGWRAALAAESRALGDADLEYFFFQTLIGSWPFAGADEVYRQRVEESLRKAAREARVRTSWAAPQEEFEGALMKFIGAAFESREFLASFEPLARKAAMAGVSNSLAQTTLKLTCPDVPDTYQGAELWDLSLVDPDNRRTVDFVERARMLEQALSAWRRGPREALSAAWRAPGDARIKLLVTALLLDLRRRHPALFAAGDYLPCDVDGSEAGAFMRSHGQARLLVVFRRFSLREEPSGRVALPPAPTWENVLSGERRQWGQSAPLPELLDELPVGVYLGSDPDGGNKPDRLAVSST